MLYHVQNARHRRPATLALAAAVAVGGMGLAAPSPAAVVPNLDIADITWSLGPSLPAVRKAGAVGWVNDTLIYAAGAQDSTTFETTTTYAWTPGAPGWTNVATLPVQNAYLDGITMPDGLYAVGGRFGGMGGTTQRTVRRLRFSNGNWVWDQLPQLMNLTRGFHTVAATGSRLFAVAGGRFASGSPVDFWDRQVKDVEMFDTANPSAGWTRLPDLPGLERFGPISAGVNGKLYVFGGTNIGAPGSGYDSDRLNDAYVYNPLTNAWSSIPSPPFGFSNAHATVWNDRYIIMVGGVAEFSDSDPYPPTDPNFYNNMVVVYDTRKGTYSILPSLLPKATGDIRTVLVGTTLYALGGETKGQETPPLFTSDWFRVGQLQLGPGEWDVDGPGDWTDPNSWSTTVPNGVGALANLLETITVPRTVTLDAPVTAGFVTFTNSHRYTIAGSATLTLQVAAGDGFVSLNQGNHTISAPIVLASPMKFLGPGALTTGDIASNTTLTIQTTTTSGRIDGTGTVLVTGGRTLTAGRLRQSAVTVNGTLNLSGGGSDADVSRVSVLTIAGGASPVARLNVGDAGVLVDYAGASPFNTIRSQVLAGRAGGAWTGNGITSTSAAANPGTTGVGYAEAAQIGLTSLDGQAVDATAILVRHTLLGDANLDRLVNIADFSVLAANFNVAGPWGRGDFNYDGSVGIADFSLLAANFNLSLPASRPAAVPEPASAAGLAVAMALVSRRRARGGCPQAMQCK